MVPTKTASRERWTGTIFIFLSTFFYALSNLVIRYLTAYEVDNDWILFYKEIIGVSLLVPWLLFRWGQGRFQYTSKRLILYVIIAAVWCQLVGARLHVQGFAVVGLIITVPLVQSSTLLGVAMLGYFVHGNSLSLQRKFAIAFLIVALTVLSIGKAMTGTGQLLGDNTVSAGYFLLVAAGTIVAGIAYAIHITMLRYVVRQQWNDENSARLSFQFRRWIGHDHVPQPGQRFHSPFPITLMMSLVLVVGAIIFGTCLYSKHGTTGFYDAPDVAWHCIGISGAANLVGFFFQIQGLRMTSAVQASLIAVSQMLLLSLIGYLYFDEVINMTVMVGLGLTVCGVFMSAKPER